MSERKAYTVAVGTVDLFNEGSRRAVRYIKTLDGFLGVHLVSQGELFYFLKAKKALKTPFLN